MYVVLVRRIVSAETIRAGARFHMNHRRAVVGEMLPDRRAGCKRGKFSDLDSLERFHD